MEWDGIEEDYDLWKVNWRLEEEENNSLGREKQRMG